MPRCLRAVAVSRVLVTDSFVILRLPPSKIPPSTHDSADDIEMVLGVVAPLGVLPFFATLKRLREQHPPTPMYPTTHASPLFKGGDGRGGFPAASPHACTTGRLTSLALRTLPLLGLVSSLATYPSTFGARSLRAPPACPVVGLPSVLYQDALETMHVCALVASLLCVLPSRAPTRLSEDATQAGLAAFLLHAPMWPILRPLFMLSDAAGLRSVCELYSAAEDEEIEARARRNRSKA